MCTPETAQRVKAKLSQKSQTAAASNAATQPIVYLNLPADYSGDIWHVAAALVVDCRVQVVFTKQSDKTDSKDYRTMEKAKAFFLNIGIARDRIHEFKIDAFDVDSKSADTKVRALKIDVSEDAIKRDICSARTHQEAAGAKLGQPVHAVYSSTYIWVSAMRTKGRGPVLKAIQTAFLQAFEERHPKEAKAIRDRIAEVTQGASQFLFLNMRMANYHPEDNTSQAIYRTIATLVYDAKKSKTRLIRVGSFNPKDTVHTDEGPDGGLWMKDLGTEVVDIYNFCTLESGLADMQSVAYFWAQVASLPGCLGVIGGRSGSSDIAGLMGNRLLCWTICRPPDPGYQRQQIMVGQIMALIDLAGNDRNYKSDLKLSLADLSEESKAWPPDPPTLADAVRFYFSSRLFFGPHCYAQGGVVPTERELHEMVSGPSGKLGFCFADPGTIGLTTIDYSKTSVYSARERLSRDYEIGYSPGDGMNCLIWTVMQVAGDVWATLNDEEWEQRVHAIREELMARYHVEKTEELDFVLHGEALFNAFRIRVRLIRIDSAGHLQDTGVTLGTTGPVRYILYEGDGNSGHFRPMRRL